VLCLSLLIVFVGNSSLNVALRLSPVWSAPRPHNFNGSSRLSLVSRGLLFSAGAIGDRYGRKGALQLGLAGLPVAVVPGDRVERHVAADRSAP